MEHFGYWGSVAEEFLNTLSKILETLKETTMRQDFETAGDSTFPLCFRCEMQGQLLRCHTYLVGGSLMHTL